MSAISGLLEALPKPVDHVDGASGRALSYRIRRPASGDGAAPPLVFLHGFNGSGKSWACQFAHFTDRAVAAVDFPGYGGSDAVEGGMEAVADGVAGLVSGLDIGKPVLVGHSMGGMLAQVIAARHPGLCTGLVLSCTHKGRGRPAGEPLSEDLLERIAQRRDLDDAAFGELRTRKMLAGEVGADVLEFLAAIAGEIRVEGIECGGRAMQELDTTGHLAGVGVPVLNLTAEDDTVVADSAAAALREALPRARHVRLAGVGHAPYCEDAAAFNEAVEGFLAGLGPRPGAAS